MNHPEFLRQTEERLLRYAAVTTQSSRSEEACPSSPGQRELAKLLFQTARPDNYITLPEEKKE